MWTLALRVLRDVAVVTEHLVALGEATTLQVNVDGVRPASKRPAMSSATTVDVVDGEKRELVLSAASAPTSVGSDDLILQGFTPLSRLLASTVRVVLVPLRGSSTITCTALAGGV